MVVYGRGQSAVDLPEVKMACRDTEDATQLSRSLLAGKSFYCIIGIVALLGVLLVICLLRSVLL